MKKILTGALLLALLLTACSIRLPASETEQPQPESAAGEAAPAAEPQEVPEEDAAPEEEPIWDDGPAASPADAEEEPEPVPEEESEDSGPDIPDVPVTDREGTDGSLPLISEVFACAAEINDDIDGRFGYLVGDEYCRLRYEWHTGCDGRVLSVLIAATYEGDQTLYTVYDIDMTDGSRLSGRQLLGMLGVGEDTLAETELSLMGGEYEAEYGSVRDMVGEDIYTEQLEKTVSPDNAELDRVWLGDGGQLMFVARIYSLAGADFFEYPMSAGYVFS